MLFDEAVLRANLGCSIITGHIAVCRFGPQQVSAVVVVSKTYDKLIVYEAERGPQDAAVSTQNPLNDDAIQHPDTLMHHIAIREDVIQSVSSFVAKTGATKAASSMGDEVSNRPAEERDLLLIGCANSVILYDTYKQTSLLSLSTAGPISLIAGGTHLSHDNDLHRDHIVCGGSQRMYAIRLGRNLMDRFDVADGYLSAHPRAEISSERSLSINDRIVCMTSGYLTSALKLVLIGLAENAKIRAYELDTYDCNIRPCCMEVDEGAQVNCLCPIYTATVNQRQYDDDSADGFLDDTPTDSDLPDIQGARSTSTRHDAARHVQLLETMNHFAYGLENGFIGVYRLATRRTLKSDEENGEVGTGMRTELIAERLWRQRCKQVPVSMLMHDVNGDGLDELVVGYRNGRLEARSPFTGQLLAVTRCFRPGVSAGAADECCLAGLGLLYTNDNGGRILVACSSAGSLVGFRLAPQSKPRVALQSYNNGYDVYIPEGLESEARRKSSQHSDAGQHGASADDWTALFGMSDADARQTADSDSLPTGRSTRKQSTADAGQQQQLDSKEATAGELHIESHCDATKPVRCEARQNKDLLRQLSLLLGEQARLEKRACQIYHTTLSQASAISDSSLPSHVNISHRWDFDFKTMRLKLTIVVTTMVEQIRLVELIDSSSDYLKDGHLMLNPIESNMNECYFDGIQTREQSNRSRSVGPKYYFVVVPLSARSKAQSNTNNGDGLLVYGRQQSVQMRLRVYSEATKQQTDQPKGPVIRRIRERDIEVPRFSTFILAPEQSDLVDLFTEEDSATSGPSDEQHLQHAKKSLMDLVQQVSAGQRAERNNRRNTLKMSFKLHDKGKVAQTLVWLNENFLCFRLGQWIGDHQPESPGAMSPSNLMTSGYYIGSRSPSDASTTSASRRVSDYTGRASVDGRSLRLPFHPKLNDTLDLETGKMQELKLELIDINGYTSIVKESVTTRSAGQPQATGGSSANHTKGDALNKGDDSRGQGCMLRLELSVDCTLSLESNSLDLISELVRSLVIDRLQFELSKNKLQTGEIGAGVAIVYDQLGAINNELKQFEETEQRIQAELYESAEHTDNLMQQFAIAIQLDEFGIARDLLNELSMMQVGAQNAARAHSLNNKTRLELQRQADKLKEDMNYLVGGQLSI